MLQAAVASPVATHLEVISRSCVTKLRLIRLLEVPLHQIEKILVVRGSDTPVSDYEAACVAQAGRHPTSEVVRRFALRANTSHHERRVGTQTLTTARVCTAMKGPISKTGRVSSCASVEAGPQLVVILMAP